MSVMSPALPQALPDRFAAVIDVLCRSVAARGGRGGLPGPFIVLVWSWLRRTARRFARLAAKVEAGTLPRRRRPAAHGKSRTLPADPPPDDPKRPRRPPRPRLPRGFAWLPRLVPAASVSGSQLQHLLGTPEMAALLEAAPQAGRLLRPLCRMLGVRLTPALVRPHQPRPPARPGKGARRPAASRPAVRPDQLAPPPPASPVPLPRRPAGRGPPDGG